MRPIYIFDIDGTIANIEHRVHILQDDRLKDKWRVFYDLCDQDKPNTRVLQIMETLRLTSEVLFFSGRSSEVRDKTVNWICDNTSFNHGDLLEETGILTMRELGDYTPDHELKASWLERMVKDDVDRIAGVFDDRSSVVKMWRQKGLTCFQVQEGDF